ncbi:MAG: FAD-dependent oxidoreductase [Candidatus Nanopelagicales bacterium]
MTHALQVLVIGGDAAGMSAAGQVTRSLGADVAVTVLEQQSWTSYSACGIPYWIAGEVDGPDALVARSPQEHRERGIDVRTGLRATAIDPADRVVSAVPMSGGQVQHFPFDHLVIGTGAHPLAPPIPGLDLPGVHHVQTLDEAQAAIDTLARAPRHAVVLGAGYIGVEMAEACVTRGLATVVVERAPHPLGSMDPEMGALVRQALTAGGVAVHTDEAVREILAGEDGGVRAVVTDHREIPADIVFVGLGVTPRSELARAAGLPIGEFGGILTDDRQQVLGHERIWSGGDCVEVIDRLTGQRRFLPMGTHANKHGRVIGLNIAGGDARFPGVVGTVITKFCATEIARTGLSESEVADPVSRLIQTTTATGYMPDACPMAVKIIADRADGRVVGTQIVGGAGAGKRIDTAATAIWNGMTAEQIVGLDLAYSPPFSGVWDPVQVAARALASSLAR